MVFLTILALMITSVLSIPVQATTSNQNVVVSIPVGESNDSVGYTDVQGKGTPEGPGGFCVYGDNLYLIDNANSLIKVFDKNTGKAANSIKMPADTWAFGIAVDGTKIYLLDASKNKVLVLEGSDYDKVSEYFGDFDLDPISQFGITDTGSLYIVRSGEKNMESILLNLSSDNKLTVVKSINGNIASDNSVWSVHWPDKDGDNSRLLIDNKGSAREYELPKGINKATSAVHYIGCSDSGMLLDVTYNGKEYILAIDQDKGLSGFADISGACYALSNNNISYDNKTGEVFVLKTLADKVQIIKPRLTPLENDQNLFNQQATVQDNQDMSASPESTKTTITRSQIMSTASSYHTQQWWCNSYNYNGTYAAAPWTRPRYINQGYGKYYTYVPYCWGGFSSLSQFSSQLTNNYAAGNISCSGSYKANTTGVDCSGYVSRCWGLTSKQSTYGLMSTSISTSINFSSLLQGDILCNGSHVMLFDSRNANGDYVLYESTTLNSYDRVSHTVRTSSYIQSNYGAYRYNNVV